MTSPAQLELLAWKPPLPAINFSGHTYDVLRDYFRLNNLLRNFRDVMLDQGWLSMEEVKHRMLEKTCKKYGDASLRARHNNFRNKDQLKPYYISESKNAGGGLWLYRLTTKPQ